MKNKFQTLEDVYNSMLLEEASILNEMPIRKVPGKGELPEDPNELVDAGQPGEAAKEDGRQLYVNRVMGGAPGSKADERLIPKIINQVAKITLDELGDETFNPDGTIGQEVVRDKNKRPVRDAQGNLVMKYSKTGETREFSKTIEGKVKAKLSKIIAKYQAAGRDVRFDKHQLQYMTRQVLKGLKNLGYIDHYRPESSGGSGRVTDFGELDLDDDEDLFGDD